MPPNVLRCRVLGCEWWHYELECSEHGPVYPESESDLRKQHAELREAAARMVEAIRSENAARTELWHCYRHLQDVLRNP